MAVPPPLALPPSLESLLAPGGLPLSAVPLLPVQRVARGAPGFSFKARRARLPRDHPLLEDGDVQRHLYLQEALTGVADTLDRPKVPEFTCHVAGCLQFFNTLEGYEHHYNALHMNVCSFCKRSFPSGHLLDVHILEWHDSLFQILSEKQDMYQCLVEGCQQKFKSSRDRKDHLVKAHLYPSDFRFDKPKKAKSQVQPRQSSQKKGMAVSMDVTPEGQVENMDVCPSVVAENVLVSSGASLHYKHRVPSTICFGQGAVRVFKNTKKKK